MLSLDAALKQTQKETKSATTTRAKIKHTTPKRLEKPRVTVVVTGTKTSECSYMENMCTSGANSLFTHFNLELVFDDLQV